MILVFVDDILCISHAPNEFMEKIGKVYDLRNSAKEPDVYLGANIYKYQTPDGGVCWAMLSNTYVKNALETVKELLCEEGRLYKQLNGKGEWHYHWPINLNWINLMSWHHAWCRDTYS
jgi:hypothetical protein